MNAIKYCLSRDMFGGTCITNKTLNGKIKRYSCSFLY